MGTLFRRNTRKTYYFPILIHHLIQLIKIAHTKVVKIINLKAKKMQDDKQSFRNSNWEVPDWLNFYKSNNVNI